MSILDISSRSSARASNLDGNGVLGTFSLGASLTALLAKLSCCVLPLVLVALGTGSAASSALDALVPYQTPLLMLGGIVTAAAWVMHLSSRKRVCAGESGCGSAGNSRSSAAILIVSTAIFAVAASWPLFQPIALNLLAGT